MISVARVISQLYDQLLFKWAKNVRRRSKVWNVSTYLQSLFDFTAGRSTGAGVFFWDILMGLSFPWFTWICKGQDILLWMALFRSQKNTEDPHPSEQFLFFTQTDYIFYDQSFAQKATTKFTTLQMFVVSLKFWMAQKSILYETRQGAACGSMAFCNVM